MGKATKARLKPAVQQFDAPPPEQLAKGEFAQGGKLATGTNDRAGLAYRRVPVIDTLRAEHKLTQRQYDGLSRYRTVAVDADRSPIPSCIDFSVRGSGEGLPHFGVRINIELGRLEGELHNLVHIARAVAVEDETLSAWAVRHSGGKERLRGAVVAIEPSAKAYKRAWMDLRFAGDLLAAAIGA